jgi:ribosomal protein L20
LKKNNISLDRKSLSTLAEKAPKAFEVIAKKVA